MPNHETQQSIDTRPLSMSAEIHEKYVTAITDAAEQKYRANTTESKLQQTQKELNKWKNIGCIGMFGTFVGGGISGGALVWSLLRNQGGQPQIVATPSTMIPTRASIIESTSTVSTMTPFTTEIASAVAQTKVNAESIFTPSLTLAPTTEVPATAVPTINILDNKPSQYLWDMSEILGKTENGIFSMNMDKFRTSLNDWINTFGKKDDIRANITVEMLSKSFGKNGMSTSHALNFWEKEGGRGWMLEDSNAVSSWNELQNKNRNELFSQHNGEYRMAVVGQAKEVETIVIRELAERQLRISGKQNMSQAEIVQFLKQTGIKNNIKSMASGLLRTVGYNVLAKNLPDPDQTVLEGFSDPNNQFNVCITYGKDAKTRNDQKETSTNVQYKTTLEEDNGDPNAEDLKHSDGDGNIAVFMTEDAKGKVVIDVVRFTNITDKLNPTTITPLVDSQAGETSSDGDRWIPCGPSVVATTIAPVKPAAVNTPTADETPIRTPEATVTYSPGQTPVATATGVGFTPNAPTPPNTPSQNIAPTYTPLAQATSTPFGN